jgi:hypothetical protein
MSEVGELDLQKVGLPANLGDQGAYSPSSAANSLGRLSRAKLSRRDRLRRPHERLREAGVIDGTFFPKAGQDEVHPSQALGRDCRFAPRSG